MKPIVSLLVVFLGLTLAHADEEHAWVRFTPERPGVASDAEFSDGWQAIEKLEFFALQSGDTLAGLRFQGAIGPSTPRWVEDALAEAVFSSAELVLRTDRGQARLLLERVRVAETYIHWDGGDEAPRQELLLTYAAITYIYEPAGGVGGGTYGEVDLATGVARAGDYRPRDPDVPPVFGATLTRDESLPNRFSLSWASQPGIQYIVERTADLTDPDGWRMVSAQQTLSADGRSLSIAVAEPRGFYRIRER